MFWPVASFELRQQLRSPVFWVGCAIFFLLTFGSVTVDQIQIGAAGNTNVNAPFAILQTLAVMSLFAVFVHVAMVAGAVIRDDETGFAPLIRSTRLGRGAYLGGRFVGAATAAFLVLACMPLAVAVGAAMPWLDAEKVGPFVPGHYLWALFVWALPTMLIVAAGCFALATLTRSMMWSYIAAVAVLVGYFVTRGLLRDPAYDTWAALGDPFGLSALSITTRYWTAAERNTLLPPLEGLLLANRLLWSGLALALLAFTVWRFRFADPGAAGGAARPMAAEAPRPPVRPLGALPAPQAGGWRAPMAALAALTRHDMGFVFRSPAFFVLLAIGVLNGGASAWFTGEWYGSGSYPVTRLMVQALQGAFTIMPIVIAIYYAGELVWRDRERRLHEIVDATPAPDLVHLLPKIAAIALVLAATGAVAVLTGMGVQLAKGWTRLEPMSYLLWFWAPTLVVALQLAVLSVFVQVLVPHKALGWALMLLQVVASVALATAGFEHNLYSFAGTPPVPLSDFNGMSRFWVGAVWFMAYWSAFCALLAVLAWALWPRGAGHALRPRLRRLPSRLRGPGGMLAGAALAAWAGCGVWIFQNTNRLETYLPAPEAEALLAEAEKALLPLETLPLPRIEAVTLDVQLFPRAATAVTHGRYVATNRTDRPIEELVLQWNPRLTMDELVVPGATLAQDYDRPGQPWGVRRYRLQPAWAPGQTREIAFRTTLAERGFPNGAPLTRIVDNGSFLANGEITPGFGIDRERFLKDRSKRRQHGLPPDLRPPKLEDETARWRNPFRADSGWVQAEIRVTTDADQTPIAPGQAVSETVQDGRRSVLFRPDAPINHFFSIQSARYEVRRDRLGEIELAVYYHPGHGQNVERMLKAMKASLALFSEAFSPYQFKQARILEFPYANFAQSFANTIPYSENLGFLSRLTDPQKIDVATYVTAHEIAHQWWGHQLVPSDQQGSTLLVESFAQYSALLVMEQLYGPEQMRRFLRYELDRYLRARGGEVVEELPLARVENQPYIHYQKGSLALWWLKEVVGAEVVNATLAELLKRHAFREAPYANARDFLAILREKAGPAHEALIVDLFETITLWDVKTTAAQATKRPDGRWDLALTVQARKLRADGTGRETEVPMTGETFEVGAFRLEPGADGFDAGAVLAVQRLPLSSGTQTLRLVLDQKPAWAGVDPYNKRIDRNSGDNGVAVD